MGFIKLHGNTVTDCVSAALYFDTAKLTNSLTAEQWQDTMYFHANFDSVTNSIPNIGGGNFEDSLEDIQCFRVYRQCVGTVKMEYLGDMSISDRHMLQDYTAANRTDYQYHIYPVKKDGSVRTPISTSTIALDHASTVLIGLNLLDANRDIYEVDINNIWVLTLNMKEDSKTWQTGKTVVETLSAYPKILKTKKNYETGNVGSILGVLNARCEFEDTVDMLQAFKTFVSSTNLKLYKDVKGQVIPCDVTTLSYTCDAVYDYSSIVSFGYTQLDSIENITVLSNIGNDFIRRDDFADQYARAFITSDGYTLFGDEVGNV